MSKINVNTVDTQCGSTLTLGSSGKTVTLASGASQSGFGRTGTVDWCTTAKTSPFTAVSGDGFFVNTTSGAVTVTLPASPSAGDIVAFKDYASTFATNNLTICNNSSKINGACGDATLDTNGQAITLVYVDSTKGWKDVNDSTTDLTGTIFITATGGTVVTNGDFKTHIFTSDGTFCVSAGSGSRATVDYLVVAGAGGGGVARGGGGGAGGFRVSAGQCIPSPTMSPLGACVSRIQVTGPQAYPITVGAGGSGQPYGTPAPTRNGCNGSNSVFSTITSAGGGGGGDGPGGTPAAAGGSGGGGAFNIPADTGGAGNTPPVSPPQGQPGSQGNTGGAPGPTRSAGAGGGAGGTGGAAPGGKGGIGSFIADPFVGPTAPSYGTSGPVSSVRYFAGGGGAGMQCGSGGAAPDGGGGTAGKGTTAACDAANNTGGGGGGSGEVPASDAGNGGSGIVMIRYKFQ